MSIDIGIKTPTCVLYIYSPQVRVQLEALVTEKSALAQENARLQRENTNLQELLSYTMHQQQGMICQILSF